MGSCSAILFFSNWSFSASSDVIHGVRGAYLCFIKVTSSADLRACMKDFDFDSMVSSWTSTGGVLSDGSVAGV